MPDRNSRLHHGGGCAVFCPNEHFSLLWGCCSPNALRRKRSYVAYFNFMPHGCAVCANTSRHYVRAMSLSADAAVVLCENECYTEAAALDEKTGGYKYERENAWILQRIPDTSLYGQYRGCAPGGADPSGQPCVCQLLS